LDGGGEGPDVFLVEGGIGAFVDERLDPGEGDPTEEGGVVFWGDGFALRR